MSLETTSSQIADIIKKIDWTAFPIADDAKASSPQGRMLGVKARHDGFSVDIASEGLDLKAKSKLDKQIIDLWQEVDSRPLIVNFKRKKPHVALGSSVKGIKPGYSEAVPAKRLASVDQVILVASGKGGVGKSSVSANLASTLAQEGYKVGLFDADLQGPSMPMLFKLEGACEVTKEQKIKPKLSYGVKVQSFGFMMDKVSPFASKGPILSRSIEQLLFKTDWGELDYLIIDTPPGTSDILLTLTEKLVIDNAVIVTTPQGIALSDVHKGLSFFEKSKIKVAGVIENMSQHVCRKCGHIEAVFGDGILEFCEERSIALLGRLPLDAQIGRSEENGKPASLAFEHIREKYESLARRIIDW